MPSPQLSFPITAALSVRMKVVPRSLKVFSLCWMLNWNGLAACVIRPAHHHHPKRINYFLFFFYLIAHSFWLLSPVSVFWSLGCNCRFGSSLLWRHSNAPSCEWSCVIRQLNKSVKELKQKSCVYEQVCCSSSALCSHFSYKAHRWPCWNKRGIKV